MELITILSALWNRSRKTFSVISEPCPDENKMKNCGLTVLEEDGVPYFAESRAVVICRIMGRNDFDAFSCDDGVKEWYLKDGVHTLYHGEIIKVLVKE